MPGGQKKALATFTGAQLHLFPAWHDQLTTHLHSKGKRVRQAPHGRGPFKNMKCVRMEVLDDVDDADDLHGELMGATRNSIHSDIKVEVEGDDNAEHPEIPGLVSLIPSNCL